MDALALQDLTGVTCKTFTASGKVFVTASGKTLVHPCYAPTHKYLSACTLTEFADPDNPGATEYVYTWMPPIRAVRLFYRFYIRELWDDVLNGGTGSLLCCFNAQYDGAWRIRQYGSDLQGMPWTGGTFAASARTDPRFFATVSDAQTFINSGAKVYF